MCFLSFIWHISSNSQQRDQGCNLKRLKLQFAVTVTEEDVIQVMRNHIMTIIVILIIIVIIPIL